MSVECQVVSQFSGMLHRDGYFQSVFTDICIKESGGLQELK